MIDNCHAFAAIRGIQSGREYYVTMVPLRVIPTLFHDDGSDLPAELRAQRALNRGRVPEITRYVTDNPRAYTFSALTASVDGKVRFEPLAEAGQAKDVGRLVIPMSARFLINDGQHRRAAIEAALKERPELGAESLSVIFFVDAGLRRSQQMFSDLNRHVVRPPQSLNVLYDHRDPLARVVCRVVDRVSVFKALTETERAGIPGRANKLFTLNGIYRATRQLLRKRSRHPVAPGEEELAAEFWEAVSNQIAEWRLAAEKKISCDELRREFVHAHGVALEALGIAGAALMAQPGQKWQKAVKGLRSLDWSRSNEAIWEGTATVSGRVSKAHVHVTRTADLLKRHFGVDADELPADPDQQIRKRLRRA